MRISDISHLKDTNAKVLTDLLPANITDTDDLLKNGGINITLSHKIPSEIEPFHPTRIKYPSAVTILIIKSSSSFLSRFSMGNMIRLHSILPCGH